MPRDISFQFTQADRSVLTPLAEHRILTTPQIAVVLDVSYDTAARRLRRLRGAGLVRYRQVVGGGPGVATITRHGLDLLENSAPIPTENLGAYRHDVGLGWLWLGAQNGAFGVLGAVVTEREMRIGDASGRSAEGAAPHGIGLGLLGPHGNPQRHYPDLLLHTESGHRVAVELELTAKSSRRMSRIMTAYATDPRIDAVVYLVPTERIERLVDGAAGRAGISDLVDVRRIAADGIDGVGAIGAPTRVASRAAMNGKAHHGGHAERRRADGVER